MKPFVTINTTASTPLGTQIQEQIRSRIRNGDLKPGRRIPSIRELSADIGVSPGIVQQAIATLTRENYLRTHAGRGIFVNEDRLEDQTIALVLPTCELEQMPRFVRGVKRGLEGHTSNLIVMSADSDFDDEIDLIKHLDKAHISGAIIYPPLLQEALIPLRELQRRGIPFVLVNSTFDDIQVDAVTCDWRQVGRVMFEELLANGHRRIGVVRLEKDAAGITDEICYGAVEALYSHGLALDELPAVRTGSTTMDTQIPWMNGRKAALRLFHEHPEITAVAAFNDYLTLGTFRAAREVGLRVPQELSVIGFSDLEVFTMCEPPVTIVDIPHEKMAFQAAGRLLQSLKGERNNGANIVRLAPSLIPRGSVGHPSKAQAVGDVRSHVNVGTEQA